MIYCVIVVLGICSSIIDTLILRIKNKAVKWAVVYSVIYYCVTVSARTVLSNGGDYLSFSFGGKGLSAYVKVVLLILLIYIFLTVIRLLFSKRRTDLCNKFEWLLMRFAAIMILVETLYIILVNWPDMYHVLAIAGVSACLALIDCLYRKLQNLPYGVDYEEEKIELKHARNIFIQVTIPLILYALLYIIVGPTELILYNKGNFVFSYLTVLPVLFLGALLVIVPEIVLLPNVISDKVCRIYGGAVLIYSLISYVQSLFLNGKMNLVDGGEQNWNKEEITVNIIIWLVAIIILVFVCKKDKGYRFLVGLSAYLVAIQLITGIFVVIKEDGINSTSRQLTEEGVLDLSEENNTVVFILDAYDVQMLQYVIDEEPNYLNPLHDFTYFDNMTSRYTATDGSLPYLLTGADIDKPEIEKDQSKWYANTHFLSDIKDLGYDIRILTENKYVEQISEGLIDNYLTDGYCRLDPEKTLELFTRCMRYKSLPYIFKHLYRYEEYDITNVITDTNVYLFGTDSEFDNMIREYGICKGDIEGALRIYHLYGAHSPYYLTENAELDYNSTPLAQWKGSLKIVYDYIEALKDAGLYDDTTLIIMADHGLNNTQRNSVKAAGLSIDEDKTNPIFFIKRAGDKSPQLRIEHSPTSHDMFFDTVRESMDLLPEYYGTVWD